MKNRNKIDFKKHLLRPGFSLFMILQMCLPSFAAFNHNAPLLNAITNPSSNTSNDLTETTFKTLTLNTGNNSIIYHATGNLNNDKTNDLVLISTDTSSISVYQGKGDGTFINPKTISIQSPASFIKIVDVNNDSLNDILLLNSSTETFTILINNNNFSFSDPMVLNNITSPSDLETGDFNNDGYLDTAILGGDGLYLYLNTNDENIYELGFPIDLPFIPQDFSLADFNNDDNLDIATITSNSSLITIFYGDSLIGFTKAFDVTLNNKPTSLEITDFNNDKRIDLIAGGQNKISIAFNNGNGFNSPIYSAIPSSSLKLAFGHFDNNGFVDIISANANNTFSLIRNTGTESFSPSVEFSTNGTTLSLFKGDYNNDNKDDISFGYKTGLQLLIQNSVSNNSPSTNTSTNSPPTNCLNGKPTCTSSGIPVCTQGNPICGRILNNFIYGCLANGMININNSNTAFLSCTSSTNNGLPTSSSSSSSSSGSLSYSSSSSSGEMALLPLKPTYGFSKAFSDVIQTSGIAIDKDRNILVSSQGKARKLNPQGNVIWQKDIGAMSYSYNKITSDSLGNVYVIGTIKGTEDFDGNSISTFGSSNLFLTKYAPDGTYIWTKVLGSYSERDFSSTVTPNSVIIDKNDNIYITGQCRGYLDFNPEKTEVDIKNILNPSFFLTKINNDGSYGWTIFANSGASASVTDSEGLSLTADCIGNIYVVGRIGGSVVVNATAISHVGQYGGDNFILKVNPNGSVNWVKVFDTSIYSIPARPGIVIDNNGEITFTTKEKIFHLNNNGTEIWNRPYTSQGITIDKAGNIYCLKFVGERIDYTTGVIYTSTNGKVSGIDCIGKDNILKWSTSVGTGTGSVWAEVISSDTNNDIYYGGNFWQTIDFDFTSGIDNLTSMGVTIGMGYFTDNSFISKVINDPKLFTGVPFPSCQLSSTSTSSSSSSSSSGAACLTPPPSTPIMDTNSSGFADKVNEDPTQANNSNYIHGERQSSLFLTLTDTPDDFDFVKSGIFNVVHNVNGLVSYALFLSDEVTNLIAGELGGTGGNTTTWTSQNPQIIPVNGLPTVTKQMWDSAKLKINSTGIADISALQIDLTYFKKDGGTGRTLLRPNGNGSFNGCWSTVGTGNTTTSSSTSSTSSSGFKPGQCIKNDTNFTSREGGCKKLVAPGKDLVWRVLNADQVNWDTAAYRCNLNTSGYADWRLPTLDEAHYLKDSNCINYLDTTGFETGADYYVIWTSTGDNPNYQNRTRYTTCILPGCKIPDEVHSLGNTLDYRYICVRNGSINTSSSSSSGSSTSSTSSSSSSSSGSSTSSTSSSSSSSSGSSTSSTSSSSSSSSGSSTSSTSSSSSSSSGNSTSSTSSSSSSSSGGSTSCLAGQILCNSTCVNGNCCSNSQCLTSQVCTNNKCIQNECNDGKDNDNDGVVDFFDKGCTDISDNSEAGATCDSGKVPCDGYCQTGNCCTDSQCSSTQACLNYKCFTSQCSDGKDNDNDGLIDLNDKGCTNGQDNLESGSSCEPNQIVCNGKCTPGNCCSDTDKGCDFGEFCKSNTCTKTQCNDGIDNDNDGLVDLSDRGCLGKNDNDESGASCAFNEVLCDGKCLMGSCCTDAQCGNGLICKNNNCVCKKSCNGICIGENKCCVDSECPSGYACQGYSCVLTSTTSSSTSGSTSSSTSSGSSEFPDVLEVIKSTGPCLDGETFVDVIGNRFTGVKSVSFVFDDRYQTKITKPTSFEFISDTKLKVKLPEAPSYCWNSSAFGRIEVTNNIGPNALNHGFVWDKDIPNGSCSEAKQIPCDGSLAIAPTWGCEYKGLACGKDHYCCPGVMCGDGIVQGDEQCDGGKYGNSTCDKNCYFLNACPGIENLKQTALIDLGPDFDTDFISTQPLSCNLKSFNNKGSASFDLSSIDIGKCDSNYSSFFLDTYDLDNNNSKDLIYGISEPNSAFTLISSRILLYRNTNNNLTAIKTIPIPGDTFLQSLKTGNYDSDSNPEIFIIVKGRLENFNKYFIVDGLDNQVTFTELSSTWLPQSPIFDYRSNLFADGSLIAYTLSSTTATIYKIDVKNKVSKKLVDIPNIAYLDNIKIADINNDGTEDIIAIAGKPGGLDSEIRWWSGKDYSQYTIPTLGGTAKFRNSKMVRLDTKDIDSDGDTDLGIAINIYDSGNFTQNYSVYWLEQNNKNWKVNRLGEVLYNEELFISDFNKDQKNDILVTSSQTSKIFLQDQNKTFIPTSFLDKNNMSDCSYCGDGFVGRGEECDDGNSFNNDQCTTSCKKGQLSSSSSSGQIEYGPGGPTSGSSSTTSSSSSSSGYSSTTTSSSSSGSSTTSTSSSSSGSSNSSSSSSSSGNTILTSLVRNDIRIINNSATRIDNLLLVSTIKTNPLPNIKFTNAYDNFIVVANLNGASLGAKPYEVHINYKNAKIPYGFAEKDLKLFQSKNGKWIDITTNITPSIKDLVGITYNFTSQSSNFAIGIGQNYSPAGVTSIECGDGIINQGEECEDGNTISGDGCSSTCRLERFCFNAKSSNLTGSGIRFDTNNDGTLDATVKSVQTGAVLSIYYDDYSKSPQPLYGTPIGAAADLDLDGRKDLVFVKPYTFSGITKYGLYWINNKDLAGNVNQWGKVRPLGPLNYFQNDPAFNFYLPYLTFEIDDFDKDNKPEILIPETKDYSGAFTYSLLDDIFNNSASASTIRNGIKEKDILRPTGTCSNNFYEGKVCGFLSCPPLQDKDCIISETLSGGCPVNCGSTVCGSNACTPLEPGKAPPGKCKTENDQYQTKDGGCSDLKDKLTISSPGNINSLSLFTWNEANNYCENLNEGGFCDWRLPRYEEYQLLTNYGSIKLKDFVNNNSPDSWSKSLSTSNATNYQSFNWDYNQIGGNFSPDTKRGVHCIRGASSEIPQCKNYPNTCSSNLECCSTRCENMICSIESPFGRKSLENEFCIEDNDCGTGLTCDPNLYYCKKPNTPPLTFSWKALKELDNISEISTIKEIGRYKNKLVVFGGSSTNSADILSSYNEGKTWTTEGSLPIPYDTTRVISGTLVDYKDKALFCGSSNNSFCYQSKTSKFSDGFTAVQPSSQNDLRPALISFNVNGLEQLLRVGNESKNVNDFTPGSKEVFATSDFSTWERLKDNYNSTNIIPFSIKNGTIAKFFGNSSSERLVTVSQSATNPGWIQTAASIDGKTWTSEGFFQGYINSSYPKLFVFNNKLILSGYVAGSSNGEYIPKLFISDDGKNWRTKPGLPTLPEESYTSRQRVSTTPILFNNKLFIISKPANGKNTVLTYPNLDSGSSSAALSRPSQNVPAAY